MTKEDVLEYYKNKNDSYKLIEFARRYTEEHVKKEWKQEFAGLLNQMIIAECFEIMFKTFHITTVENIKTGQIYSVF